MDFTNKSYLSSGVTCICYDTEICHHLGYIFGGAPEFLDAFLGYSRTFGYIFFW